MHILVTPTFQVQAKKEVILSAGSVGTPQILQLSGIGAAEDLAPLGIPVLVENSHVGRNLQDHPLLPNIFTVHENTSIDHILRDPIAVQAGIAEWAESRSGFITNNVINNLGFQRLHPTMLEAFTDPSAGPHTPHFEIIFAVCVLIIVLLILAANTLVRTIGWTRSPLFRQRVVTSPSSQQSLHLPPVSTTEFPFILNEQHIEIINHRWNYQDSLDEPFRCPTNQP